MLAVVGHGQRFGEALAFVVAGARPHRVHVAPVRFHLRVDHRVAIASPKWKSAGNARASPAPGRACAACRPSPHPAFRWDVPDNPSGWRAKPGCTTASTGPAIENGCGDVLLDKLKRGSLERCPKLRRRAGEEIVEPHHRVAFRQQAVAQMGPDEAGGAGNHNAQVSLPWRPYSS